MSYFSSKIEKTKQEQEEVVVQSGTGLSIVSAFLWLIPIPLCVRRPQRQVIPEQLHDERRVFIAVLIQGVQLRNRIIECLCKHTICIKLWPFQYKEGIIYKEVLTLPLVTQSHATFLYQADRNTLATTSHTNEGHREKGHCKGSCSNPSPPTFSTSPSYLLGEVASSRGGIDNFIIEH
ncbi:hypothetical protein B566_EDAN015023 [Ephemera danica]|nr:hypothetical protein B566_EDAN015023 [Ephemera danica]